MFFIWLKPFPRHRLTRALILFSFYFLRGGGFVATLIPRVANEGLSYAPALMGRLVSPVKFTRLQERWTAEVKANATGKCNYYKYYIYILCQRISCLFYGILKIFLIFFDKILKYWIHWEIYIFDYRSRYINQFYTFIHSIRLLLYFQYT